MPRIPPHAPPRLPHRSPPLAQGCGIKGPLYIETPEQKKKAEERRERREAAKQREPNRAQPPRPQRAPGTATRTAIQRSRFPNRGLRIARCPAHRRAVRTVGTAAVATAPVSHFSYQDGVLCAESVSLTTIADAVGTPCFVYSRAALTERSTPIPCLRGHSAARLLRREGQQQPRDPRSVRAARQRLRYRLRRRARTRAGISLLAAYLSCRSCPEHRDRSQETGLRAQGSNAAVEL